MYSIYNFFNGDHGLTKAIFPWFHLIIPSSILIKRINTKQLKQINSIQELGLNMYSLKNYTDIFEKSNFQIEMLKKNCSTNPITVIFKILSRIKFLEEFCTFNIFLILNVLVPGSNPGGPTNHSLIMPMSHKDITM